MYGKYAGRRKFKAAGNRIIGLGLAPIESSREFGCLAPFNSDDKFIIVFSLLSTMLASSMPMLDFVFFKPERIQSYVYWNNLSHGLEFYAEWGMAIKLHFCPGLMGSSNLSQILR